MSAYSTSAYEQALRTHLATLRLSPSHTVEHLNGVLAFAMRLQGVHGGDIDVLVAAVLLHDLGRGDSRQHGAASATLSARQASDVLASFSFPAAKRAAVLQAIAEHDQPEVRPSTLEGRILKDADFLAGMGAVGIVRSALWTGESGGSQADFLDRLMRKMPARMASLEFPESRREAQAQYLFVELFAERLQASPSLELLPTMPYVVFEGISGSGKSTQVELLVSRFARYNYSPLAIREPTPAFRQLKQSLPAAASNKPTDLALLLLDRFTNVAGPIEATLAAGQPVIADRSYVSSMVYQSDGRELSPQEIAWMHRLMPQPTSLILLDIAPQAAFERIEGRLRLGNSQRGTYETLDLLATHRERYQSLQQIFPFMHVLDAQLPPQLIHELVWKAIMDDMPSVGDMGDA